MSLQKKVIILLDSGVHNEGKGKYREKIHDVIRNFIQLHHCHRSLLANECK